MDELTINSIIEKFKIESKQKTCRLKRNKHRILNYNCLILATPILLIYKTPKKTSLSVITK